MYAAYDEMCIKISKVQEQIHQQRQEVNDVYKNIAVLENRLGRSEPTSELNLQRMEERIISWQENIEKTLNDLMKKVDGDKIGRNLTDRYDQHEVPPVRSERVDRLQKFERMDIPEKPPIADNYSRPNKYNSDYDLSYP